MTADKPEISVVIPVYRSQDSLRPLVERLQATLHTVAARFEIILVNDGSPDQSWEVIEDLARQFPAVHGINLMRNFGQHNALLCGVRAAQYALVMTMDDDLQHPPEEMPLLLAKLAEGYDVVYGTPQAMQHGCLRNLASQMTKLAMQSAMGAETARNISAYRVFRTQVREAFAAFQGPFVSLDVLLTWGTRRFGAVPVRHNPRAIGASNYNLRRLFTHCFNMLTGFSTMPLQLASWTGFALTLFGAGILVYVIGRYLISGCSVAGFPFLASIIAIFSGAQLFALGIIGEYLARMHFRMMERPTYFVRSTTRHPDQPEAGRQS